MSIASQEDDDYEQALALDETLDTSDPGSRMALTCMEEGVIQSREHNRMQEVPEDEPQEIVKRVTNTLLVLRITLGVILIAAAISVSWGMYCLVKEEQRLHYTTDFHDYSETIVGAFNHSTSNKFWAAHSIASTLTSFFASSGMVFPNLTLTDFPVVAVGARIMAEASAITFSPVLFSENELAEWEAFATRESEVSSTVLNLLQDPDDWFTYNRTVADGIYSFGADGQPQDFEGQGPYVPIWHISPRMNNTASIMFNQMAGEARRLALENIVHGQGGVIFSKVLCDKNDLHPTHVRGDNTPRSVLYAPVPESYSSRKLVGVVGVEFDWENYFETALLVQSGGLIIVVEATSGQEFTLEVGKGGKINFVGKGDLHDPAFDDMLYESTFEGMHDFCHYGFRYINETFGSARRHMQELDTHPIIELGPTNTDYSLVGNHTTHYRLKIYSSQSFKAKYISGKPAYFALVVGSIFLFTSGFFIMYDRCMERRQNMTMESAVRSTNVLNSLYPANVRRRLFQSDENILQGGWKKSTNQRNEGRVSKNGSTVEAGTLLRRVLPLQVKSKLKSFLVSGESMDVEGDEDMPLTSPIADLFPSTTVLFADISGFTAWSSEREPAQVFQLLETLYRKFDRLARKHGVFKVETIGDCYVAVTGLPEPNDDHAAMMCRFALAIRLTMRDACKRLESILGPGTADLSLRIGVHSGAVTAGVLRGEKSRFQLFGDTVNTASRMESNSLPNRIQLSQATAELLVRADKADWFEARSIKVEAKGKGTLQTYWLRPRVRRDLPVDRRGSIPGESALRDLITSHNSPTGSLSTNSPSETGSSSLRSSDTSSRQDSVEGDTHPESRTRLICWNVEVLASSLEKLVAMRQAQPLCRQCRAMSGRKAWDKTGSNPIDELTDVIEMPVFCRHIKSKGVKPAALDKEVRNQLHHYVSRVASMYRDHPFHNLDHASHVVMSACKLMNRIVVLDDDAAVQNQVGNAPVGEELDSVQKSTLAFSSDPLVQFAVIFSALIHDVDHTGLTNAQLVNNGADVALMFQGKSVAEQNSITVAWSMLVEPQYGKLCNAIFPTTNERQRFRQLIVTMVMATDIINSELQLLRKKRWEKAFLESPSSLDEDEVSSRKATIVIEHIIQASDVAHTMQHWHVFCRWNEKLFQEKYEAYLSGHEEVDPTERWYENEIGFLDNYVIPLAKKLKDCGVFGVCSDEYLGFALENRVEWEMKGREVVQAMAARARLRLGNAKTAN